MSNKQVLIIDSKMAYTEKVDRYGTKMYYKDGELHRDGDKPAIICSNGTKTYWKNGERHRDGDKPAVIYGNGDKEYWKNGVRYTKEQVEKMEEIRTRIINRTVKRCARYWYDETYRNTEGEAFKRRLLSDMDQLENEIGYKFD